MNRHLILKVGTGAALLLTPLAASAQNLRNIETFIKSVGNLVQLLLPILVTIALLAFFWGLIKYIREANNPEAAKEGKTIMIYGIIALFVMVSVWGIVKFIGSALDIRQGDTIPVPGVDPEAGRSNSSFGPALPQNTVNSRPPGQQTPGT